MRLHRYRRAGACLPPFFFYCKFIICGGTKAPPYGDLEFIAPPNVIKNPTKRTRNARPYGVI